MKQPVGETPNPVDHLPSHLPVLRCASLPMVYASLPERDTAGLLRTPHGIFAGIPSLTGCFSEELGDILSANRVGECLAISELTDWTSGYPAPDEALCGLPGDNVVWQVEEIADYLLARRFARSRWRGDGDWSTSASHSIPSLPFSGKISTASNRPSGRNDPPQTGRA